MTGTKNSSKLGENYYKTRCDMNRLEIIDVRVTPGDSAYLLVDEEVSILYDTGFGFTGEKLAEKLEEILSGRQLDYIFLTHSHYDHCLGIPYIKRRYPNVKVVAGEYTADVFTRPNAILKMKELDTSHARYYGIEDYEFLGEELRVDIVVRDGQSFCAGGHIFKVVAVPGHTKCSIAFYEERDRLLLSSETLGIYHKNGVLPITLVGFATSLMSIDKMLALDIDRVLIPHLGEIRGEDTKHYLSIVKDEFFKARDYIIAGLREKLDREELIKRYSNTFAGDDIGDIYPKAASHLNSSIMISLIEKEYADMI